MRRTGDLYLGLRISLQVQSVGDAWHFCRHGIAVPSLWASEGLWFGFSSHGVPGVLWLPSVVPGGGS